MSDSSQMINYSTEYFVNENRILKTQVNNLNAEIDYLKQDNFRLGEIVKSKSNEITILEGDLKLAENLNKEYGEKNADIVKDHQHLNLQLLELVENNKKREDLILSRENEIKNLTNSIEIFKKDLERKDSQIDKLSRDINTATTDKINICKELAIIQNSLANEKFVNSTLSNEISNLRNEILTRENSYTLERNTLRQNLSNLTESLTLAKEEVVAMEQKMNIKNYELNMENNNIKFINENLKLKVDESSLNLELKDKKIDELSKMIIELQRHIQQQQREVDLLKEIINDKETEVKNLHHIKAKVEVYENIERKSKSNNLVGLNDIELIKNEYTKLNALYTSTKSNLDAAMGNLEEYQSKVSDLEGVKEKYQKLTKENEELIGKYLTTSDKLEEIQKVYTITQRESEILNELSKKLSQQNRELLFEIKLGDRKTQAGMLGSNLSRPQYEEFIYTNIADLEGKFSELLKRELQLKKENDKKVQEIEKLEQNLKEKDEVISNYDNLVKELEDIKATLKRENEMLKYYSETRYNLFTIQPADQQFDEGKLKQQIGTLETNNEAFRKENAQLLRAVRDFETKLNAAQTEVIEVRNSNLEKERELNNLKANVTRLNALNNNNDNLVINLNSQIVNLKSQIEQNRTNSSQLLQEKENLITNLSEGVNHLSFLLNETKSNLQNKLDQMVGENQKLKDTQNLISRNIVELMMKSTSEESVTKLPSQRLDVNVASSDEVVRQEFETLREKLGAKEREYLKMKMLKSELEIKTDNLATENYTLKYQIEMLENRVTYYQNLLSSGERAILPSNQAHLQNSLFIKKIEKNAEKIITSIMKEKRFNVTNISSRPHEQKKYSINVSEEVGRKEELVMSEREIMEEVPSSNQMLVDKESVAGYQTPEKAESSREVPNQLLQSQVSNISNVIAVDDKLYNKYLEALREIENLSTENKLLRNKIDELNFLNQSLVKNDLLAPYKYLFNKLEDMNGKNLKLENEKFLAIEEKEKLIKDFSFINEKNETLKRTVNDLEEVNRHLSEKIVSLEARGEEQMKSMTLYHQSKTLINEKDETIRSLNEKISSLEVEILQLKNQVENANSQLQNSQNQLNSAMKDKSKEVSESKVKSFNVFYNAFKKSKRLMEVLLKLRDVLEEKIDSMQKTSSGEVDFSEINRRHEQQVAGLKRKIRELEDSHSKTVQSLSKELELQKEKELALMNDVRVFKNINQIEGSLDTKTYLSKLLKSMTTVMNMIKFKDAKIRELERDIKQYQNTITILENEKNTVDLTATCEKCQTLSLEVQALSEANKQLSNSIKGENEKKRALEHKVTRYELENSVAMKEVSGISNVLKSNEITALTGSTSNIAASSEKNKVFFNLINQMRKATRIITLLDKHTKNLENQLNL